MGAHEAARHDYAAQRRDAFADLRARAFPSPSTAQERLARLKYESLYLLARYAQYLGDLAV